MLYRPAELIPAGPPPFPGSPSFLAALFLIKEALMLSSRSGRLEMALPKHWKTLAKDRFISDRYW
jgi:hypothetical protein